MQSHHLRSCVGGVGKIHKMAASNENTPRLLSVNSQIMYLTPLLSSMFHRFALIRTAGGNDGLVRIVVLLLGCICLPIAEWYFFGAGYGGAAVLVLTILGWLFRSFLMQLLAIYHRTIITVLVIYGAVFFLAKYLGYGYHTQVVVITVATAVVFNLNYWAISEAVLYAQEYDDEDEDDEDW